MNRKSRPTTKPSCQLNSLTDWHKYLLTRRRFLIAAAGGSVAAIFPLAGVATAEASKESDPWLVIDTVQQHLFPAEDNAPGAQQVNAQGYLRFVLTDTTLDSGDREFILRGVDWLEDMAKKISEKSFIKMNYEEREKVLQKIAGSDAGENWLSTIMLYIVEALLTDPVYGGNTNQVGWKWLQHVPGYPRPPKDKMFHRMLS